MALMIYLNQQFLNSILNITYSMLKQSNEKIKNRLHSLEYIVQRNNSIRY